MNELSTTIGLVGAIASIISLFISAPGWKSKMVHIAYALVVTAVATRSVEDQEVKLSVVQTAQADKFLSSEIESDLNIKKGKYTFIIGEKTVSFNWRGGKYKNFINLLNEKGKDKINAKEIKITPKTTALLFSSEITGEKNRLIFEDDALELALNLNLIKKNDSSKIKLSKETISVNPESTQKINFSETAKASNQLVMELELSVTGSSKTEEAQQQAKDEAENSKIFEQLGSVSYKGIYIQNEPSKDGLSSLPTQENIPKPEVNDMSILALESSRGVMIPLPPVADIEEKQVITVPLAEYGNVKALAINNNNTSRSVIIDKIRIFDPKAAGDYIPVNPVSTAQDSIINFEGIQIKREKNNIDDLVAGLTINLHEPSEKQEKITVKPDVELVKNSVIEFVAKYNRLIAEINILTKKQPEVITELGYLSEEEVKEAEEKLGLMFGDTTLLSLKNNLRQMVTVPYKSHDDTPIFLLSQLGISGKSDKAGGIDMSRLTGYLEIDEKKLDEALNNNMKEVKLFFGYDSDGDILIDSGLAHSLYEQINPYTERGGIFGIKTGSLKTKMDSSKKKIDNYDKKLAKKEQELKRKYGLMDGTLKKLNKQSQAIENFNKQMNNQNKNK